MYNADDHDITADIDIGCESNPEKNTDDDEDLYLYVKIIV